MGGLLNPDKYREIRIGSGIYTVLVYVQTTDIVCIGTNVSVEVSPSVLRYLDPDPNG